MTQILILLCLRVSWNWQRW